MSSPYKTFSIHSFGCKVNFADAATISTKLLEKGLSLVDNNSIADIYIVNTCSVTENADNKANKFIKSINLNFPFSKIVVTGCYAQLEPQKINALPGVNLVVGMKDKFNIDKFISDDDSLNESIYSSIEGINKFESSYSTNERTRSFIKIQDGCSYNCSYCTIPNARGISRSGTIDETIDKIKIIVNSGIKEIVLSGINVGDFGDRKENLYNLLVEIEKIVKLKRYRISSIEPNLLNDKIINLISKSKKALPHFHIPLQSGSNKVLKDMKRRYNTSDYKKLIVNIKNKIPDVCIGVDVIVGFPTESDDNFMETYNFIKQLEISYLHVFSYSKRANTEAFNIPSIVNRSDIIYRRKMLQELSSEKLDKHIYNNLNQVKEVLFEEFDNGVVSGLTDNYIRVYVKSDFPLKNKIKKVKLVDYNENVNGCFYE